LIKIRQK